MKKAVGAKRIDLEGERLRELSRPKGAPLERARINLTWLSRAIEDGTPLEAAIKEVYTMGIYGFAGDLRLLLKEVK